MPEMISAHSNQLPIQTIDSAGLHIQGTKVIETSLYKYYGPQGGTTEAQVAYLEAHEMCNPPAAVAGLIVVGDRVGAGCTSEDIYVALDRVGAAGFVMDTFYDPPGLTSHYHGRWDMGHFLRMAPVLVEASQANLDLAAWRAVANTPGGLHLRLAPPHSRVYEDLFAGWFWWIAIRGLIPAISLATAKVGPFLFETYSGGCGGGGEGPPKIVTQ